MTSEPSIYHNAGSPWGQSPWGGSGGGRNGGGGGYRGGNGGGQEPPDFDALFRKGQEQFKNFVPSGMKPSKFIFGIIGLLLAFWLASGLYRIAETEIGIELTFGEWTNKAAPAAPGLHWHWPSPIGAIEKPRVTQERRTTVGFVAIGDDLRSSAARRNVPQESSMLTGDENIVNIDFMVLWDVSSAGDFLFNVFDVESAVKRVAESSMRGVIGQRPIVDVLTERRDIIQSEAKQEMQRRMDAYVSGVRIRDVQLLDANPPEQVIDAFNDVQRARADKDRARNQAEAYANDVIPRAQGQAVRLIQEAEAYKEQNVNKARGDAERFRQVYEAYAKSKDVTTKRLYLETLEEILRMTPKILIDNNTTKSGVLPYLPLQERRSTVTKPAQ